MQNRGMCVPKNNNCNDLRETTSTLFSEFSLSANIKICCNVFIFRRNDTLFYVNTEYSLSKRERVGVVVYDIELRDCTLWNNWVTQIINDEREIFVFWFLSAQHCYKCTFIVKCVHIFMACPELRASMREDLKAYLEEDIKRDIWRGG
jgi:hypothetical protein